jgi:poly-gamma-glutamate synthase PgsB/CapB
VTWLLIFGVALVLGYLAWEAALHARRLRRIRVRIHVNGTRGKTSVTRLLAAALRQAGLRTIAKVTGDEPRLILPDGTEQRIPRRGPARIHEQMWFVRRAVDLGAEAIVVECMALAPELQRVSEERMICSTVGVITNVRPDHFEVMGPDLDAVAEALAGTIPRQGVLVTADRKYFARFAARAAAKGTRTILAEGTGAADGPMSLEDEHAAIVRAVCAELRITGVPAAAAPAGASLVRRIEADGRRVFFVNAFSANDPVSTALLQASVAVTVALPRPRVALLNNRADRPLRMLAFAEALRTDDTFAAVALGGELAPLARRRLRAPGREIWSLRETSPDRMVREIGRRVGDRDYTIVGMGNAKGLGLACARYFEENGTPCP